MTQKKRTWQQKQKETDTSRHKKAHPTTFKTREQPLSRNGNAIKHRSPVDPYRHGPLRLFFAPGYFLGPREDAHALHAIGAGVANLNLCVDGSAWKETKRARVGGHTTHTCVLRNTCASQKSVSEDRSPGTDNAGGGKAQRKRLRRACQQHQTLNDREDNVCARYSENNHESRQF